MHPHLKIEEGLVQKIQAHLETIFTTERLVHAEPPQLSLDHQVQRAILMGNPRELYALSAKITQKCLENLRL